MALITYSFKQIVGNFTAAAQASAAALLNFSVGSVNLAIAQATGAVSLWLQALALYVLGLTRAATSNGADLDSWMAQFDFPRIPGTVTAASYANSQGQETFGRNFTTLQVLVPIGAQVQQAGGAQVYTVVADATNPNYTSGLSAYVIPAMTASISVTVESVNAVAAANANAGTITQMVAPIPGVDYVTNASAFTGATDPETDSAYRIRFVAYLAGLSKATYAALSYAISQVQTPIFWSLTENYTLAGVPQPGYFYAIIDDGTGSAGTPLLALVYSTLFYNWRAFTITYGIFAAGKVVANFSATVTTAAGFNHSAVTTAIQAAIVAYINGLTVGQSLSWTKLVNICYSTVPNAVLTVQGALLNSGITDLTCSNQQVIRSGSIGIA